MEETDNICFVCDKKISSEKWKYKLQVTATKKRNVPAADLIKHLVGEEYAVLVGERDAVCSKCMNLLNLMDSLTVQLGEVTAVLTKLLHTKYNLTSEINNVGEFNLLVVDLARLKILTQGQFDFSFIIVFCCYVLNLPEMSLVSKRER